MSRTALGDDYRPTRLSLTSPILHLATFQVSQSLQYSCNSKAVLDDFDNCRHHITPSTQTVLLHHHSYFSRSESENCLASAFHGWRNSSFSILINIPFKSNALIKPKKSLHTIKITMLIMFQQLLANKHYRLCDSKSQPRLGRTKVCVWSPTKLKKTMQNMNHARPMALRWVMWLKNSTQKKWKRSQIPGTKVTFIVLRRVTPCARSFLIASMYLIIKNIPN